MKQSHSEIALRKETLRNLQTFHRHQRRAELWLAILTLRPLAYWRLIQSQRANELKATEQIYVLQWREDADRAESLRLDNERQQRHANGPRSQNQPKEITRS